MRKNYSDEAILEGLRKRKKIVIEYLYHNYGPLIRNLVRTNSGTQHDYEDLFQDGIIVLYGRSLESGFTLSCSLKTYLIAVCRNLWMQRLERKYKLWFQCDYEAHEEFCSYTLKDQHEGELDLERQRLMYKNIRKLPEDCQKILLMYVNETPYWEIARQLNVKSEDYIKSRKYTCKNLLRKKIMNDPESYKLFDYE